MEREVTPFIAVFNILIILLKIATKSSAQKRGGHRI